MEKCVFGCLIKIVLFAFTLFIWLLVLNTSFAYEWNLLIIVGSVVLVFPVVWLGRMMLDRQPTLHRAAWITTFVHVALMILFGVAIIRAVITHQDWYGWKLPIPVEIGLLMVIFTGAATLLTVGNLALKGLGAPFAIVLRTYPKNSQVTASLRSSPHPAPEIASAKTASQ